MNLFRYSSSWGHLKLPFRLALYQERVTDLTSSLRPDPVSAFCCFSCLRFFSFSCVYAMYCVAPEDVIYCTLPLYHGVGVMMTVGCCLMRGNTVALRRKFSASRFWDDCVETKATVSTCQIS